MSSNSLYTSALCLVCAGMTLIGGCGGGFARFSDAPPMQVDVEDTRPFTPMPEEYWSGLVWDGADQIFFRPVTRFFAVDPAGEAVNVNAFDEVADSSWFTNRLGRSPMTEDEFVLGSCAGELLNPDGPAGSWTVVDAKPNGANPGFIIESEGTRYLLKFDSLEQPERATAADVLGSILYHAAGYFAPCNRMVYFPREILEIGEGATVEILGEDTPMTMEMLEPALAKAPRNGAGLFRASASRFLPDRPLGPWRYEGTRDDDPNDVIPHQERRDVRGGGVLAAWLNHFDSREQNTLAAWAANDGGEGGHVRHYLIDWGDCLGSQWEVEGLDRRLGHSSYFDGEHIVEDFLTFGMLDRPWYAPTPSPAGHTLGYFTTDDFVPDQYRPGYSNPAFSRASERDNAWMTRIVARMTPQLIRAALDQGQVQTEIVDTAIYDALIGRRRKILNRWLHRVSPLTAPEVSQHEGATRVCFENLAVTTGLVREPSYWVRLNEHVADSDFRQLQTPTISGHGARVCVALAPRSSGYLILELASFTHRFDATPRSLRAHLYVDASGARLVGLERPYDSPDPDRLTVQR